MSLPVLEIENLSVSFMTRSTEVPAVMDFSMKVSEGDAMGLVGESGCGKSTVALAIMNYLGGNGKITGGSIKYRGRDMSSFSEKELRDIRGSEIAMIYQEPMASLNPAMRISSQLIEVPLLHEKITKEELDYKNKPIEVFERVDIEFSDADYDQAITDLANNKWNYQQFGYIQARQEAYGSIGDQLDMQYWDAVNGTTTWKDHIAQVKSDNPKPE